MGERTRTTPIGYRNTVVLTRKGNTAPMKQDKKMQKYDSQKYFPV